MMHQSFSGGAAANAVLSLAEYSAAVSSEIFPMRIELGGPESVFRAALEKRRLGCLSMVKPSSNGVFRCLRPSTHHRDQNGQLVLHIQETGAIRFRDSRQTILCGPNSMVLIDPSRGCEAEKLGPAEAWNVTIPTSLIKGQVRRLDNYCGAAVDTTTGVASLLRQVLKQAWDQHASLNEYDAQVLPGVVLRLVEAAFHNPDAPQSDIGAAEIQLKRLRRLIAENLHDPGLSATWLAIQLGVSRSSLYAVTSCFGTSIGRLILEMRLDQVRDALSASEMRGVTITQVAFSYGFQELSHFSRSFKERFGASPRVFRAAQAQLLVA